MISVEFVPDAMTLRVLGHADSDEYGKDLICAGCSTLVQTLVHCLEDLDVDYACAVLPGDAVVICNDDDEQAKMAFAFAVTGFRWLSDQWGEYISLTVRD